MGDDPAGLDLEDVAVRQVETPSCGGQISCGHRQGAGVRAHEMALDHNPVALLDEEAGLEARIGKALPEAPGEIEEGLDAGVRAAGYHGYDVWAEHLSLAVPRLLVHVAVVLFDQLTRLGHCCSPGVGNLRPSVEPQPVR